VALCTQFITEVLPKEGVNTLVLEINYGYAYQSHPELASAGALEKDDLQKMAAACKEAGIRLIPQFNCLGHQSWDKHTFSLLTTYPQFDETPGAYPNNEEIYCRSYCTLHPDVHAIVFALIDELIEACGADAVHVGMDEVFLLGEDECSRCKGKNKAELLAHEINTLHNHLQQKQCEMWMWSDRFLDGRGTGIGKWEASYNHTEDAIDMIPKDIVMCDWHYEKAHPTAIYFALKGFPVVSSPWRKPQVALNQLKIMKLAKENSSDRVASNFKGMLHTTWCGMTRFIQAYHGEDGSRESATESAACFKALFQELRNLD